MKRPSTFILGSLMALSLAACDQRRNDGAANAPGSESGSMSGDTASTMDTTMGGGTDTGITRDTTDTTAR